MKVPPDFKANLDLAESIKRFRSDSSSDSKTRFFRDLKEARLLVPCKGDASHVAILNTPQGEGFLPAFSCVRELQKGDFPCEDTAVLFLDDLKHLLVDLPALTGVVIDPFGKA